MIQPKLSLEKFQQNLRIQKVVGEKLGYHLQNQSFSPPPKSNQKQQKQQILIRQNINPLHVSQKQRKPSKRLEQLNKQIQQMQIHKKVSKMTNSEQKANMNVIELLNNKIRQYNYLVDHKHITNRKKIKSQYEKKNSKQKQQLTSSVHVLQKIKIKQKDLNKTGSLITRFKRNQQLSHLYREYSKSMKLSDRSKVNFSVQDLNSKKTNKNQIKIGAITTDTRINAKIKPIFDINKGQTRRYQEDINIQYPFVQKKSVQNFNQLNEGLKRNRLMSKFMRQKLKNMKVKNQQNVITNLEQQDVIDKQDPQLKTQLSQFSLEYNNMTSKLKPTISETALQEQQSYLSLALSKRSPKYVKSEGSKFLIKFDNNLLAKSMLQGSPKKQKQPNKIVLQIPKLYSKKTKIPQDLTNEQKSIMEMMIEDESDSYYWTTCRNEKINLMLKGKKHQ